jgi:hypothetical protein
MAHLYAGANVLACWFLPKRPVVLGVCFLQHADHRSSTDELSRYPRLQKLSL